MQPNFGQFGLGRLTVITPFHIAQNIVKGRQPFGPLGNLGGDLHLVLVHVLFETRARKAHTSHNLQNVFNRTLVVHGTSQLQMTKIPRIGLVVQAAQARVVDSSIDGLTLDLCLVTGHPGWNLTAIDRNGLGHRVLAQQETNTTGEPQNKQKQAGEEMEWNHRKCEKDVLVKQQTLLSFLSYFLLLFL